MVGLSARDGGGGGDLSYELQRHAEEPLCQAAGSLAPRSRRRGGRGVPSTACARSQSAVTQPSVRKFGDASAQAPSAERK